MLMFTCYIRSTWLPRKQPYVVSERLSVMELEVFFIDNIYKIIPSTEDFSISKNCTHQLESKANSKVQCDQNAEN